MKLRSAGVDDLHQEVEYLLSRRRGRDARLVLRIARERYGELRDLLLALLRAEAADR